MPAEVASGIDGFEVKGGATFEGNDLPFLRLLAAIKQRRSVVQLGDGTIYMSADMKYVRRESGWTIQTVDIHPGIRVPGWRAR